MRAQGLLVSFLGVCKALHMRWLSRFAGICWGFLKFLWTSHAQLFLLSFCPGPGLPQLFLPPLVAAVLNSYYWLFFIKPLGKRLFPRNEVWVRSNKDKSCKWGFPGYCHSDQTMSVLWEWCLGGNSNTVLSSPVAASLLVSVTVTSKLLVFKNPVELGKG